MKKDIQDLTGFEMIELKKVLGTSLESADGIEATYALTYIFKKREDASFTHEQALGMTLKDVQEYMGVDEEEEVVAPFEVAETPKD